MSAVSSVGQASGRLLPENTVAGDSARARALVWLNEAMLTVQTVYNHVNWGTSVDPGIQAAFDDALAARFWGIGEIEDETFKKAWRAYYKAHL
jgi:hypothetical protein